MDLSCTVFEINGCFCQKSQIPLSMYFSAPAEDVLLQREFPSEFYNGVGTENK